MHARLIFYGLLLGLVLFLGAVARLCVPGVLPCSPPLTALDLQDYREALQQIGPSAAAGQSETNAVSLPAPAAPTARGKD